MTCRSRYHGADPACDCQPQPEPEPARHCGGCGLFLADPDLATADHDCGGVCPHRTETATDADACAEWEAAACDDGDACTCAQPDCVECCCMCGAGEDNCGTPGCEGMTL